MTMANSRCIKRRRTCHRRDGFFGLPDEALLHVASYLTKPSRALLALALTTESSRWRNVDWNWRSRKTSPILSWAKVIKSNKKRQPSEETKLIVSAEEWDTIDFLDVDTQQRRLQLFLKDDDVAGVLACVDALHQLRTLKITGCYKIRGRGLEPLRGSTVLEHVDLSLVGMHESPNPSDYDVWYPTCRNPSLSEAHVLPLLDGIIGTYGNSLTLINFPEYWLSAQSSQLSSFLGRYDRLLEDRRSPCSKCNIGLCLGDLGLGWYKSWVIGPDDSCSKYYGRQRYTCSKCVKFFCYQRRCNKLHICLHCEKQYCRDCNELVVCAVSNQSTCSRTCMGCSIECEYCQRRACTTCDFIESCTTCGLNSCRECVTYHKCEGPNCFAELQCHQCWSSQETTNGVNYCPTCDQKLCPDCRYLAMQKDWKGACVSCFGLISNVMGEMIDEEKEMACTTLRKENEMLRQEIKELKEKIL